MGWFSNPKQSKSSNDLIVDALNKSLAVIEFEPNGQIITANSNFLSAMGYRLEEVQGQHLKDQNVTVNLLWVLLCRVN